jgi:squalene-hopene/tetraprenyl-beta-curcumene cyclase
VQPCVSPTWDTALALNALLESGLSTGHPALLRAADWLLDRQVLEPGDWQVKRPGVLPGGWAFQFDNPYYPDLDDTAVVAMALHEIDHPDTARRRSAIDRRSGGSGHAGQGRRLGVSTDQTRLLFNNIPSRPRALSTATTI